MREGHLDDQGGLELVAGLGTLNEDQAGQRFRRSHCSAAVPLSFQTTFGWLGCYRRGQLASHSDDVTDIAAVYVQAICITSAHSTSP
jgi:hypothetical protein